MIPQTVEGTIARIVGTGAGFDMFGWLNRTKVPSSGKSIWTTPVRNFFNK